MYVLLFTVYLYVFMYIFNVYIYTLSYYNRPEKATPATFNFFLFLIYHKKIIFKLRTKTWWQNQLWWYNVRTAKDKQQTSIQSKSTGEKSTSVQSVTKIASEDRWEYTTWEVIKMTKISEEDGKELVEASFAVLQLLYYVKDNDERIKRLKTILNKIKKQNK